jgi:hypothetical protein
MFEMGDEEENVLKTDVDQFIQLVAERGKISIQEVAKIMNTSIETVQAWADFLVEEKILGMEYKFTTPYVFVIQDRKSKVDVTYVGFDTKEEFFEKARKRNIQDELTKALWHKYLKGNLKMIQEAFFKKAKDKGLDDLKTNKLWMKYVAYLEE